MSTLQGQAGLPADIKGNQYGQSFTRVGGVASPEVLKVLDWFKKSQVVEEWHEGANFFRKYASGFIEQGGVTSQAGSAESTVSFHGPFKDSNYSFVATPLQFSSSRCYVCYSRGTKTASSINVLAMNRLGEFGTTDIDWYACGY